MEGGNGYRNEVHPDTDTAGNAHNPAPNQTSFPLSPGPEPDTNPNVVPPEPEPERTPI